MAYVGGSKKKSNKNKVAAYVRAVAIVVVLAAFFGLLLARVATAGVAENEDHLFLGIADAAPTLLSDLIAAPLGIAWSNDTVRLAALIGAAIPVVMALLMLSRGMKVYEDTGREHGDARLANEREASSLLDEKYSFNNFRYTETAGQVFQAYNRKLEKRASHRNLNCLTLGISGLGKSFNVVLPDLMAAVGNALQPHPAGVVNVVKSVPALGNAIDAHEKKKYEKTVKKCKELGIGEGFDFFTSDPKGDSLRDTGSMLVEAGFDVRCLNTVDFSEGAHYNPFAYIPTRFVDIKDPDDVEILAELSVQGVSTQRFYEPVTTLKDEAACAIDLVEADVALSVKTDASSLSDVRPTKETPEEIQARMEGLEEGTPEFAEAQQQLVVAEMEQSMGAYKTGKTDEEGLAERVDGKGCQKVADAVKSFSYRRSSGTITAKVCNKAATKHVATLVLALDPALAVDDVQASDCTENVRFGEGGRVEWTVALPGHAAGEPEADAELSIPFHVTPTRVADGVALTKTVDTIVANLGNKTDAAANGSTDPFWEDTKRLCFMALVAFLFERYDERHHTIPEMMRLLNLFLDESGDPSLKSPLAVLIEMWEYGKVYKSGGVRASGQRSMEKSGYWEKADNLPHSRNSSLAVHCFHAVSQCAPETVLSVVVSCQAALVNLLSDDVKEILSFDELHLEELGEPDSKTAIFCVTSDTPSPFDFLTALVVQQAIDLCQERAYKKHGGKLPRHVRFILDETANLGKIPILVRGIAVVRSRNISMSLFLQSKAQLATVYGDKQSEIIFDCCSTLLFLGAESEDTLDMISKMIGNETVYARTFQRSFQGAATSTSQSEQIQGTARPVRSPDQLRNMPTDTMLCFMYGVYPVEDKKIQTLKHPLYAYVNPKSPRTRTQPAAVFSERFDYGKYRKEGGIRHAA